MDFGLEEILNEGTTPATTVVKVSEEDVLKAEVEMVKLDGKMDAEFAKEEMAISYATAIEALASKYEDREMSNEELDVLTTSLEALSITGGFSKEHVVASIEEGEDKKTGTMAKMKAFIANLLKSFQVFYQKVMKYITKWIAQAKLYLAKGISEDLAKKVQEIVNEGKCVIKLDEKKYYPELALFKVDLAEHGIYASEIATVDFDKAKKIYTDESIKKLDSIVDKWKKELKNLDGVTFDMVGGAGVAAKKDGKIIRFAKVTPKLRELEGLKEFAVKDISEIGKSYINLAITGKEIVKKDIIDKEFKNIKDEEAALKKAIEEIKKKENYTTQELIEAKKESLARIAYSRAVIAEAPKGYSLIRKGFELIANGCKEEKKEDEGKKEENK
jgi:hypothetical protein